MAPPVKEMSAELSQKIEAFHAKVHSEAETILFEVFPTKILELQELIDKIDSADSPFRDEAFEGTTDGTVYPSSSASEGPETKKRKHLDGAGAHVASNSTVNARYPEVMHTNGQVNQLHEIIKRECDAVVTSCDKVKLWVNLTMPKIEDGDNFGVEVQNEALTYLERTQESAYTLRDYGRQHHLSRAKICSKIIKYPNIEDYTLALQQHDEKQFHMARQHIHDIRHLYAVMMDIIHKNIGKIRAPKANNGPALY
ncbi:proteasome activator pa28, REG alpha/beta subunit [Schizopora paradoxa]|uniref:Proteasome activator pa28, REG alpha/beta subunit n=1 Tax=Schizopora paradoxa TaxID=27342 RepID=A0A0H2S8Y1_9AGAM|nr:proteasome activator pa28, REG alpha/beta subunit [Schizopora paradoxa]